MPYSMEELQELVISVMPPPLNALLVLLVCVALYFAARMRDRTSLPWRLYQYRSKVFIVNQEGGEPGSSLRDVELLRRRLDEIERERDDLKAVLDNKRLTEKHSEVDLAIGETSKWEETVNNLQRKQAFVSSTKSELGNMAPGACGNVSSGKTATTSEHGRVLKTPPVPSKDKTSSHIPMPTRASQVFSSADYARKCREMLSKLNESDKMVAKLTDELESTKKIRAEFETVTEQRDVMGRKILALTREKKEMTKQVITLQTDIKTVREQFDDVRKQHTALTRQFDQLNTNAKAMAKDKRTLGRQLAEAKEELELAREKLDGIHLEKSRLIETIERMDPTKRISLRSVQTPAPKSRIEVAGKTSTARRPSFKNRPTNGKRKTLVNLNDARKSSQTMLKLTSSKSTAGQNNTKVVPPKSSDEVMHKLAKSLEDKCQEFVKQKSYAKDSTETAKSANKSLLNSTPGTSSQKDQTGSAHKPTTSEDKAIGDETKLGNKTKPVATRPSKRLQSLSSKSRKDKSAKDLATKSSIDITEFARSLQKLERNVEINMKVRAATDALVYPVDTTSSSSAAAARRHETKSVRELYHNDLRSWDSQTQVTTQDSPCDITASDTDTSGISASRDEYTSESEQDMELGRSARGMCASFSVCCLDSMCSVCSAPDCQLEHRYCSDVNCLATCSSCSLPLELSQSIVSYDEDEDDEDDDEDNVEAPPLDDADVSHQGLGVIFGNGPVGEGGPWNLPGLSRIMTRTTRPTGSVLACQGSLGEVGDVTSSSEFVDLEEPLPPQAEGAKKRLTCFTANEKDKSKRTANGSPAFRQFLQELSTLVQVTEAAVVADDATAAAASGGHNTVKGRSMQKDLVKDISAAESQDVFEDSEESLEPSYSHTSTQYFVNNENEPIF